MVKGIIDQVFSVHIAKVPCNVNIVTVIIKPLVFEYVRDLYAAGKYVIAVCKEFGCFCILKSLAVMADDHPVR